MDISKIELILANEYGIRTCPICATPYEPYHKRQKTCGNPECQKKYHAQYTKEYMIRRMIEDPESIRKSRRESARRQRAKQKNLKEREKQLEELQERWEKVAEADARLSEYGLDYGEIQKQKTLAMVPKIDVTMGGKEDDGVCSEDEC